MEILDPSHKLLPIPPAEKFAMKKFRYLVEIVRIPRSRISGRTLDLTAHEFQNGHEGHIHDIEYCLLPGDEFYENLSTANEQPESVVHFFQKTHLERIDTFYKNICL